MPYSLEEVRAAGQNLISQVVDYFARGNHRTATIEEIVCGIRIGNEAEASTVYSAIDPYTVNAEKRDQDKPELFRRTGRGKYTFLGYEGDPIDLTQKLSFDDPILKHAYKLFWQLSGQPQDFTTSQRIIAFHQALSSNPELEKLARANADQERELKNLNLDISF